MAREIVRAPRHGATRDEATIGVRMEADRNAKLSQVAAANGDLPLIANSFESRQEDTHQNRHDRDHNEQFDEREAR